MAIDPKPRVSRYGITLSIIPGDVSFQTELQRDTNAGFTNPTTIVLLDPGRIDFTDLLPSDGVTRHYRARHVLEGYTAGAWTSGVSGAPRPLDDVGVPVSYVSVEGRERVDTLYKQDGKVVDVSVEDLALSVLSQLKAYRSADKSISNDTLTAIDWDREDWNVGGLHDTSTNNSRLTAQISGIYLIMTNIRWAANATGYRYVQIFKTLFGGGTDIVGAARVDAVAGGFVTEMFVAAFVRMVAGDYLEIRVRQTSGGALNVLGVTADTWFGGFRLAAI